MPLASQYVNRRQVFYQAQFVARLAGRFHKCRHASDVNVVSFQNIAIRPQEILKQDATREPSAELKCTYAVSAEDTSKSSLQWALLHDQTHRIFYPVQYGVETRNQERIGPPELGDLHRCTNMIFGGEP